VVEDGTILSPAGKGGKSNYAERTSPLSRAAGKRAGIFTNLEASGTPKDRSKYHRREGKRKTGRRKWPAGEIALYEGAAKPALFELPKAP